MSNQRKISRAHRWAIACLLALLYGCTPAEESLGEREVRYQHQIAEDPTDAEAHYALGQVYHEQARYPEALQFFRRALALDSSHTGRRWESATSCLSEAN